MATVSKLQSQYQGTNIDTLLTALDGVFQKYTGQAINDFFNNIYNLDTANNVGLEFWGKILNFPRTIKGLNDNDNFITLQDDEYRVILKLLALQTKTNLTIPEINAELAGLFSLYSAKSYIIDNQDMSAVNYIFVAKLPVWLKAAFRHYNLLPSPMGVGSNFREVLTAFIGFEGQELGNFFLSTFRPANIPLYTSFGFAYKNIAETPENIGNFTISIFHDENEQEEQG